MRHQPQVPDRTIGASAAEGTAVDVERAAGSDPPGSALPPEVRERVLALAAEALGALELDDVPLALRKIARFAPGKRARFAALPLASALETDPAFRQRVAGRVSEALPGLSEALTEGRPPQAADPVTVAAAAYLLRPEGWETTVSRAAEDLQRIGAAGQQAEADALRLRDQLRAARVEARAEVDRVRTELRSAKAEIAELRHKLRDARDALRAAEEERAAALAVADAARAAGATATTAAEAEARRLRARLAEAEAAVEGARRAVREGRSMDDVRLRLLLDVMIEAAGGLRRELALPPSTLRPADTVAAVAAGEQGVADVGERALEADDPAQLDPLLALPQVHLVVDGYNVTKTGYGGLPLEAQRQRLVSGLSALAARSGAEITAVFDGAALQGPVPSISTRGVRVLFSAPGEIADELIRRLVRAEPPGRPVVVVSSDKEVADGVRRAGARAVPSAALLRRLERA